MNINSENKRNVSIGIGTWALSNFSFFTYISKVNIENINEYCSIWYLYPVIHYLFKVSFRIRLTLLQGHPKVFQQHTCFSTVWSRQLLEAVSWMRDMVKHELLVTSWKLKSTWWNLKVRVQISTSSNSRVRNFYELLVLLRRTADGATSPWIANIGYQLSN